ncbi:hypothetical protein POTOM_003051 [Populus tomentosa]|uniref:Phytocyanin domain-containing protein n=1 Tax=Populus tomentosa TaxID=118781 RepID=A0A8X8IY40_POPTO|nr:hypothetical protein POTOM_003051 [Populus tomentosa]
MESRRCLCLLWALLACYLFTSSAASNSFDVGGKDGWVTNPSESYNHWAERNRFQVNDSLVFKYNKGSDSVLLVTKDDYNSCKTKKPLKTMGSGSSVFQLDKSGPYFFISGNEDNCRKGQKLTVVVLSGKPKQAPTPVSQPPAMSPKAPSPVAHNNPSPAPSKSPSPVALNNPSPAPSKSPSPSAEPPASSEGPSLSPISPAPISMTPSGSPLGAPGPSQVPVKSSPPSADTPTLAPSPTSNTPYLAPSPFSEAPTGAPGPSPVAMTPHISLVPSGSPASSPASGPVSEISPSPLTNPPAPSQSPESPSPLASAPVVSPIPAKSPSSSIPTPKSGYTPANSPNSNGAELAPAPAASWVATPSTFTVIVASFLIGSVIGVWP